MMLLQGVVGMKYTAGMHYGAMVRAGIAAEYAKRLQRRARHTRIAVVCLLSPRQQVAIRTICGAGATRDAAARQSQPAILSGYAVAEELSTAAIHNLPLYAVTTSMLRKKQPSHTLPCLPCFALGKWHGQHAVTCLDMPSVGESSRLPFFSAANYRMVKVARKGPSPMP